MIFIDGSLVFFDWCKINGSKNFEPAKFVDLIKNKIKNKYADAEIKRTYYFATETENNKSVFTNLKKHSYVEVKLGQRQEQNISISKKHNLRCPVCDAQVEGEIVCNRDKGTDVSLTVEMLRHGFQQDYDIAVLVSRDADFVSVVNAIKSIGRNVELVLFEGKQETQLKYHVDETMIISQNEYQFCTK